MSTVRRVVKNAAALVIAQGVGYIFSFIYILYLARYLGPGQYGVLSFAIAFTGFFQIFADMGLQQIVTREIARDKGSIAKYLVNIGLVKVILAVITFVIMAATINIMSSSKDSIQIVYLLGLAVVVNALSQIYIAILQGTEFMEVQAVGQICQAIIIFIGILVGINLGFGILGFGYIYLMAGVILFIYYTIAVIIKYYGRVRALSLNFSVIDTKLWKQTIVEALPLGLAAIFFSTYTTMDSIILFAEKGEESVGWYSASYRVIQIFQFIPIVWGVGIFPVMANYYKTSMDSLKFALNKSFKYLALLAIPLGVGVTILAGKIIALFYGPQYMQSVIVLQILIWSTVLLFLYNSFGMFLIATNRQKLFSMVFMFCAILNVGLNLILIPVYGNIAASCVLTLTQAALFSTCYVLSAKNGYDPDGKKVALMFARIIIASIAMGVFVYYVQDLSLLALLPLAAVVYLVVIVIVGVLDREDYILLKSIIKRN